MSRNGVLAVFSAFAFTAVSLAEGPVFNFQSFDVNNAFTGTSVNRNGVVMGMFFDSALGSAYQTTWSASQGFKVVTTQTGDNYQSKVSDGGNVYGDSAGKIIGWNATGGRSVILGGAGVNYSLVSASDNDRLLVKGVDSTGTHYYTYSAGGGLQAVNYSSPSFTPVQVNLDGSVYGMVPGGSSGGFGLPSTVLAKLNGDGSYTIDSRSQGSYSGTPIMGSGAINVQESLTFLPNGTSLLTTDSSIVLSTGSTISGNYHVYNTNGSHFDIGYTTQYTHIGTFTNGAKAVALLGDGTMIGTSYSNSAQQFFTASNPVGSSINASNFAVGSAVPDRILFGNESVLIGQGFDSNGNQRLMIANIGTVPEPASLAVLGLGAAVLLRRRKNN